MTTFEIEEFARIIVEKVRDAAIQSNDRIFDEEHAIAKRWREAAKGPPTEFAKAIIPDVVDSTISHLLGAIDQELLRLFFIASNGETIELTNIAKEFGELSGWYMGSDGWCQKYTKERFIDDFADLNDFFNKHPDAGS